MSEDSNAPPPDPPPAFERSISPIAGRLETGRRGKAVVLAALVAGCGVFLAATWRGDKPKPDRGTQTPARQTVSFEGVRAAVTSLGAADPGPSGPTLADPGPGAPNLGGAANPSTVPALQPDVAGATPPPAAAGSGRPELSAIRAAPILAFSRGGGGSEVGLESQAGPTVASTPPESPTELDQLRRGSAIGQVRASRLPDRSFLIIAGAALPCILQTAMDTATPGYVSCLIPRDVLSDNGAVVLMEKGTKVLGEYRSSLRQGQRRLFVLWSRAVTPAGVAVDLASPAADPLGRAGFDGDVDSHFWSRFGGALLLSIVDDGAYAVAGRDTNASSVRLPSDAAGVALQNSINIPPSLRKAQGAQVSIFVARDVDFSSVYQLKGR